MVIAIPIISPVRYAEVWLGHVHSTELDGILNSDHPSAPQSLTEKHGQNVDDPCMTGSDRAHGNDFSVEEFDTRIGREDSYFRHAQKLVAAEPVFQRSGGHGPGLLTAQPLPCSVWVVRASTAGGAKNIARGNGGSAFPEPRCRLLSVLQPRLLVP